MKSSLCDYSDAFILITVSILVTAENDTDVTFKNCVAFSTCKTIINGMFVDEANHIYIAISMYNLMEYRDSYSVAVEICGSFKEMKFLLVMMI